MKNAQHRFAPLNMTSLQRSVSEEQALRASQVTPSFRYSDKYENWEQAFVALLLRHGPVPKGIKWYGEMRRLHVRDKEAGKWIDVIVDDCRAAIETSGLLSHFTPLYRDKKARHMKNQFLRWCRDGRETASKDS